MVGWSPCRRRFSQIAAMLGTSRQAAQERYGELAERP
jgi:DNA-binding Lrp family transcriptional regulator